MNMRKILTWGCLDRHKNAINLTGRDLSAKCIDCSDIVNR
jgi:hypothetical protein